MTPGQLVKAVSLALDVPEETVTQHDRNLVVAGLRTKGGRGPSAAEVTPLDAARLLVAVLGSVRTKDSVETVKRFERATLIPSRPDARLRMEEPAIKRLSPGHSFIEALAAVIAAASDPIDNLELFLERFSKLGVGCNSGGMAYVGGLGGLAEYFVQRERSSTTEWTPEEARKMEYCRTGIHQDRRVFGTAIMLLGSAFRENGARYKNAQQAYLAGYGARPQKSARRAGAH